jgi:hypothetical protein
MVRVNVDHLLQAELPLSGRVHNATQPQPGLHAGRILLYHLQEQVARALIVARSCGVNTLLK